MNEKTPEQQQAELKAWVEAQFQGMGRHVVEHRLIEGDKAEGRPIWAMPGRLFIGKVWDKEDESTAYWIVSGVVAPDHLDASVASTARDALRHFCMKWQMQAGRLEQTEDADDPNEQQNWTGIASNLAQQAEALFPVVEDDRFWQTGD